MKINFKKAISLLTVAAVIFSTVLTFTAFADDTAISLKANSQTVAKGNEVTITLAMKCKDAVGLNYGILYDSNVLTYVEDSYTELSNVNWFSDNANFNPKIIGAIYGNALSIKDDATMLSTDLVDIMSIKFLVKEDTTASSTDLTFSLYDTYANVGFEAIDFATADKLTLTIGETQNETTNETPTIKPTDNNTNTNTNTSTNTSTSTNTNTSTSTNTDTDTNTSTPQETIITFNDISGYDWAKSSIEKLATSGVLNGRGEGVFDPSANVTRAEAAKILVKALALTTSSSTASDFSDVNSTDWFAGDVAIASNLGIIMGSEGKFRPMDNITRQELCVMIKRATDVLKYELPTGENNFADKDLIATWASEAVSSLSAVGIVNGKGDNKFAPKDNASRAEAAVIFDRVLNLSSEK